MCLGPTHEEIITSVARDGLKSYKQLPVNLYQIQSKFRDEIRPRYGLLRGREFIMKDAYSFDIDEEGLDKEYKNMAQAYKRIFERCGLDTKMVQSDSGAIGGSVSHEFMVITDTDAGENDVFYCNDCDYSANSNHAISNLPDAVVDGKEYFNEEKIIDTPNTHSIEELSEFLKIPSTIILKTLVYIVDKKPVLALIRADKTVEETKLMNSVGGIDIRIASSAEIAELMADKGFDAVAGFIGPKGMSGIKIVADETVKAMKNFVVGINQTDKHLVGANIDTITSECDGIQYADIRLVERGEYCPQCGKPLQVTKGIEVGNIFKLGTKYSKPMNAVYTDINGKTHPYVMGCYGIGISRTAAAAVEAHYDEHGIKWPIQIAPYHVVIVPVNIKDELQMQVSQKMYEDLQKAGIEVVLDDRDERAGVKFKDADLIGFPYRVTVGKTINDGFVEFKTRETDVQEKCTPDDATEKLIKNIKAVL
jgi:prolyl-tRNA synthetase